MKSILNLRHPAILNVIRNNSKSNLGIKRLIPLIKGRPFHLVTQNYNESKQYVRYLEGDWICSRCSNHNFAKRSTCRGCGLDKKAEIPVSQIRIMKGDWTCVQCEYHNFAYRSTCLKCEATICDEALEKANEELKKMGDWDCPNCNTWNFSFREKCFKCKVPKPDFKVNQETI